jgi:hypothetical protein
MYLCKKFSEMLYFFRVIKKYDNEEINSTVAQCPPSDRPYFISYDEISDITCDDFEDIEL